MCSFDKFYLETIGNNLISQIYPLEEDLSGPWWDAVDDSVSRGVNSIRGGQQEQHGGGTGSVGGFQSDIPDGVDKGEGKRRGQGKGKDRGKQAISDEDLFQDLLGGYSTDVYGHGERSSWVGEKEVHFDGGVKGGTTGNGRWDLRDYENDQFFLDDLIGGRLNFFERLV